MSTVMKTSIMASWRDLPQSWLITSVISSMESISSFNLQDRHARQYPSKQMRPSTHFRHGLSNISKKAGQLPKAVAGGRVENFNMSGAGLEVLLSSKPATGAVLPFHGRCSLG